MVSNTSEAQSLFDAVYSVGNYPYYYATGGVDNGPCLRSYSGYCYFIKNCTNTATKSVGYHVSGSIAKEYSSSKYYALVCFEGPDIRIYNSSTGLDIRRGSTQIYKATGVTIPSNFTHIQVKVYSHLTEGTIQIRLNGDTTNIVDASGLNTGGQDITGIYWGCTNYSSVYYDNLYIADDFLWRIKVCFSLSCF